MGAGGEIVTKTEVLNAVLSSVFEQTNDQGNRCPELVDRIRKQNRPPFQEKVVSDLLCHIDIHKSVGLCGIHLKVLRELSEELIKTPSFLISPA